MPKSRSLICQFDEKCRKQAIFGDPEDQKKSYCRIHAVQLGFFNRINGTECRLEKCDGFKYYGLRGLGARFCPKHRDKRIHVNHSAKSRCQQPGCREPRLKFKAGIKFCAKHNENGIRDLPNDYLKLVYLYSKDKYGHNLEEVIPPPNYEKKDDKNRRLINEINKRLTTDTSFESELTKILIEYYQKINI